MVGRGPTVQAADLPEASLCSGAGPALPYADGPFVIGVISDTHGHLYPEIARLLEGVDYIIHAGDVGSAEVLEALRSIAPLVAVRGNCDVQAWATALPPRAEVELAGVRIAVAHMAPRPQVPSGAATVVISGHSHIAALEQRGDVLYLNPGSAGPRRFGRPRTIARLEIWAPPPGRPGDAPRAQAEIVAVDGD
jgi:putative phosphoesterase